MPTVSYDSQSFMIDGRRVWLASGAIHYPRVPQAQWRDRLRAAKQAGLNCIETYVFWNLHEPRPGVFDFEGEKDLRHFVQLIAQEGMYCILRPGPYVCSEWDAGGFPAWLNLRTDVKYRQANGPFMEACARYLGAVLEQVRDLQVTSPANPKELGFSTTAIGGGGGPIILTQVENEWMCHNPAQEESYLRELVRYLRENGCQTPINNCNNLWQRIDGTIDAWNGANRMATDLRQLQVVQPNAPRLVTEYWTGWFDGWNAPHSTRPPEKLLHDLVQILAAGAQYNLYMFHGGTNFAFWGGRTVGRSDNFMTTSYDFDAPLSEGGGRGVKYQLVKRVSTFATQFAHVLANVVPEHPHAAIDPCSPNQPPSVIHLSGSQGQVVYILRNDQDKTTELNLLLPQGLSLPVYLGHDRAAWLLLDTSLPGIGRLDYTNLRPWALHQKKMLVLFGPAGTQGLIGLNDAKLSVEVPKDNEPPAILYHEGLVVVVLNTAQVDRAYLTPEGLAIGCDGLDEKDQPIASADGTTIVTITPVGIVESIPTKSRRKPTAPKIAKWQSLELNELVDGSSTLYLPIDGPQPLEKLGQGHQQGYGWYRLSGKSSTGKAAGQPYAPGAADRLHFFQNGKPALVLGLGPGAQRQPDSIPTSGTVVVLAENLGRFNYGWHCGGELKGLFDHVYNVQPIKLGKPQITAERAPDPFVLGGFFNNLRVGQRGPADVLSWTFKAPSSGIVHLDIDNLPVRCMFLLNDQPWKIYDPTQSSGMLRATATTNDLLRNGNNEFKLALFEPYDKAKVKLEGLNLYQVTVNLTAKAQWAFAPWTIPNPEDFAKADGKGNVAGESPCWHLGQFTLSNTDVPLFLEPVGMSKGQLILNGQNLGRYFVATAAGKSVPPQHRYYLPKAYLYTDKPNHLMLFDEHGKTPQRCRLVFDPQGPYGS